MTFINLLPKPSNISNETHHRSQNKVLADLDLLLQKNFDDVVRT